MGERERSDDWGASFAEHRRRQLTLGLAATPGQRLARLEEMIVLAHRAGALRGDQQSEARPGGPTRR